VYFLFFKFIIFGYGYLFTSYDLIWLFLIKYMIGLLIILSKDFPCCNLGFNSHLLIYIYLIIFVLYLNSKFQCLFNISLLMLYSKHSRLIHIAYILWLILLIFLLFTIIELILYHVDHLLLILFMILHFY